MSVLKQFGKIELDLLLLPFEDWKGREKEEVIKFQFVVVWVPTVRPTVVSLSSEKGRS